MSTTAKQPAESFTPERVETELQQVSLSSIVVRPTEFSFRDDDQLDVSSEALKSLAEDIRVHGGLHTPVLLKRLPDGRFLLLDGHRRYHALLSLVAEGVEGFTADIAIPANVIVSEASELAMVARAVSANVQREPLSAEGRLKAVIRLHRLGMPHGEIARLLGISEAIVARDVALGSDEEMLDHVQLHHITASNAATLIKLARDKGRLDEFKTMFDAWVEKVQQRLAEEDAIRADRDEGSLSLVEKWPQRYLSAEQVKVWKEALDKEEPFGEPSFRFKALLRNERGRKRIEIDSLSADVFDLSSDALAKVMERCLDLAADIEPVLLDKVAAEQRATESGDRLEGERPGVRRLRELGLEQLAFRAEGQAEVDEGEGLSPIAVPSDPSNSQSLHDVLGGHLPQDGTGTQE